MVSQQIVLLKRHKDILGSRIKILSPAKLNLYLNILDKYSPSSKFYGYHCIESVMERISLCDELTIEVLKTEDILFCTTNKSINNNSNICIKAAKLIKNKFKIKFGFKIFLNKKIPIGAGLGGGSSNAASILLAIDKLLSLGLSKSALYNLGAELGSDVNFFISQSRFALAYGRGEKIIPFDGKTLRHLVIWPSVFLSTKDVYKITKLKLTKFLSNTNIICYAIKRGDTNLLKKMVFNALEKNAFFLCREVEEVKKFFENKNIPVYLTGSGSALYTILDKERVFLKGDFPKNWTFFNVKTF